MYASLCACARKSARVCSLQRGAEGVAVVSNAEVQSRRSPIAPSFFEARGVGRNVDVHFSLVIPSTKLWHVMTGQDMQTCMHVEYGFTDRQTDRLTDQADSQAKRA